MPRLVLGLTGGIGSGKSTVAQMLVAHGCGLVDADAIAHTVTGSGGRAIAAIAQTFGNEMITPDGALNRVLMRQLVFGNEEARQALQVIIHPIVADDINSALAKSCQPVVVIDIPLLVESGHWRSKCDRVLVVDCSVPTQMQRVRNRNGWTTTTIESVIHSQAPRHVRVAAADAVLCNDHISLAELSSSVEAFAHSLGL
jgi:dephospho-CoA kinase